VGLLQAARTIPSAEAFRPIDQGECPLVKNIRGIVRMRPGHLAAGFGGTQEAPISS